MDFLKIGSINVTDLVKFKYKSAIIFPPFMTKTSFKIMKLCLICSMHLYFIKMFKNFGVI